MARARPPVGLQHVPGHAADRIARLAGIEGLARAVMVGTVPLVALEQLGSKEAVSYAFFAGSLVTVVTTLNVARLERVIPRRWILTGGGLALISAATLFALGPSWSIPIAIGLRSSHASVFSVVLSLYLMDFVAKSDFVNAESRRFLYLAAAWLAGPALGTWLWSNVDPNAPFVTAMTFSAIMLAYHWRLRFDGNEILRAPVAPAPRIIDSVVRFFRRRSLRIAYAITIIRSVFWAALFIYGPIYVIEAGHPEWMAGALLSASSATLFLAPLVDRAASRIGVRTTMAIGFALMTVSLSGLAIIGDAATPGIALWLLGATGGGMLDVLGNIPFVRLVKPRERAAMASVFNTWPEVSFLIAPALAALALTLGPFWLLYAALALMSAGGIILTTYLPRRL